MVRLGFIGAGNMAEAIARGVLRANLFSKDHIIASDVIEERVNIFKNELGVRTVLNNNIEVVNNADYILLAVKPQQAAEVLKQLGRETNKINCPVKVLISICAGIAIEWIQKKLIEGAGNENTGFVIVRVMPNIALTVGEGASGVAPGTGVTKEQLDFVIKIFGVCGIAQKIEEHKLNAITGVSGSGPAYVFYLMEGMIQGGIDSGLTPEEARKFVLQTILGAAKIASVSSESCEELRKKVTSPNGTTQAAIEVMQQHDWLQVTSKAVRRATERAVELSKL